MLRENIIEGTGSFRKMVLSLVDCLRDTSITPAKVRQTGSSYFENAYAIKGGYVEPETLDYIKYKKNLSVNHGAVVLDKQSIEGLIEFDSRIIYPNEGSFIVIGLLPSKNLKEEMLSRNYLSPFRDIVYVAPEFIKGFDFDFK